MEIQQRENEDGQGRFYVEQDGRRVAEMVYRRRDDSHITINHTSVDDSLEGQGVGHELFDAAIDYARQNNQQIKAVCPFVRSVFEEDPQSYADVWEQG